MNLELSDTELIFLYGIEKITYLELGSAFCRAFFVFTTHFSAGMNSSISTL